MGSGPPPAWLTSLQAYYKSMLEAVERSAGKLGPAEWDRVYTLYLEAIQKEAKRLRAVGDREGLARCLHLEQTIREALVGAMRLQLADLIKRQFKGEAIAAANFPKGDPPADKRELFQRWERNFTEVTRALGAIAERITQHDPTYTLSLDWPDESWFKDEGIPEGLWK